MPAPILGPFELVQPLAAGGMGEIWRGRHPGEGLALVATGVGRIDEAMSMYRTVLATQRELGERGGEAGVLANIAYVQRMLGQGHEARATPALASGDLDRAEACIQDALQRQREAGDRDAEAATLDNLAGLRSLQGRVAEPSGSARTPSPCSGRSAPSSAGA